MAGTVVRPVLANPDNATMNEALYMEAWDLKAISAFMEISFKAVGKVKSVLGNTRSRKIAWDAPEHETG